VLDALQHAGAFADDEQIDELRVKRLHVEPPGACDVTIVELMGTTEATNG
jgi:Holliday junction resolvase RusA-like endonuclease